jgi:putative spermidine/putrescine transport system permease protein
LIERRLTVRNIVDVFGEPAYLGVLVRTVAIALAVTVICTVIGVPMALFMAKVAAARWRPVLLALVLTPLWASYLVKVYAWRTLLSATGGLGLGAVVVVLTYLWLPYMVLPLYTGLAGMRPSLLDAAADLGARPWRTVRTVVLPLLAPSVAAGSIFTFSLSMGDYITVQLVGGTTQMLGNVVYQNFSTNLPFAATVAALPVVVMIGYLLAARRSGALEEL